MLNNFINVSIFAMYNTKVGFGGTLIASNWGCETGQKSSDFTQ